MQTIKSPWQIECTNHRLKNGNHNKSSKWIFFDCFQRHYINSVAVFVVYMAFDCFFHNYELRHSGQSCSNLFILYRSYTYNCCCCCISCLISNVFRGYVFLCWLATLFFVYDSLFWYCRCFRRQTEREERNHFE